jgi:hypothetical protein
MGYCIIGNENKVNRKFNFFLHILGHLETQKNISLKIFVGFFVTHEELGTFLHMLAV